MKVAVSTLASIVALTFSIFSAAASDQWTRFRGPNGEGLSDATAIPATWTDKDYRWKAALPGEGNSSPVVSGQRLFITCGSEQTGTQIVLCLKTSDGSVVWKQEFPSTTYKQNKLNRYASSTPPLDETALYHTWATPEHYFLVKLEQATGKELWRRDFGPFPSQHGFGASSIVFEDLVIVPNEQDEKSSIIAVDRQTGKTRWEAPRKTEKAAFSTPCIYRPEGGDPQLILTSWAQGFSALDPRTGKPLWEEPLFKNRVSGSPLVAGGLIIGAAGAGGGGKQMYAVRPGNPKTGAKPEVAYELKKSLPYVVTPVAKGNLLFAWADSGVVTCLDLPTGKTIWQERLGAEFFGSPVLVGDRLYAISKKGEVFVLAAAEKYQLLARVDLGEPSNSTPAVAGGVMYLRTMSHVMALGGK